MKRIKLLLATIGFLASTHAAQSASVVVWVDGEHWEVTTFQGTYNGAPNILQSQEWWGDFDLARTFAVAVGDKLGAGSCTIIATDGACFAYDLGLFAPAIDVRAVGFIPPSIVLPYNLSRDNSVNFATATLAADVPLPATAIFALTGLFGLAGIRRMKKK